MVMVERILKVLKIKGLTASKFADEIGAQRSSISHILSGRNKPSLEFVLKILERYPDINPDWLLKGKGEISRGEADLFTPVIDKKTEDPSKSKPEPDIKSKTVKSLDESGDREAEKPSIPEDFEAQATKEEIEKIVIFYRNKKFRVYFPGN